MKGLADRLALLLAFLGGAARVSGTSLVPAHSQREATIRAFDERVARFDARDAGTLSSGHFLWLDSLGERERAEAYAKLKSGEAEIRRLSKDESVAGSDVPGGLIHAWEGVVFVPGAKLDDVLRVLEDYDHHATYYAPNVNRAKIESRDGDHFKVFMRFRQRKVVTVVLNTEQDIRYYRDSATKAHSRSSATRVRQVENPDTSNEKEKAPEDDDGFLWRMETWWRMEERDGGVYVQNEVVSLTRDIPMGLGWMIEPFITKIPKETLEFTLGATRKAVLARAGK